MTKDSQILDDVRASGDENSGMHTRARAEALGARCKAGIFTRAERIMLLVAGLCFGVFQATVYMLVALTAVTVAQRVRHTFRELTAEKRPAAGRLASAPG